MADDAVAQIDYSTMTYDQLLEEVGKAYQAKDMKLMGTLSRLATKAEADAAKAAKEQLQAALVETVTAVRKTLKKTVQDMVDKKELDGAEGVWFVWDFGQIEELGVNPACRLTKTGRKTAVDGGGSGTSSYTAHPAKSSELLDEIGGEVYFEDDTTVTIDKQEVTMAAGTTFKQAYDFSTNGGWRNRVRMAMLKKAGKI